MNDLNYNKTKLEVQASKSWRESKLLLLVVVTVALFVEEMLVSTVVPIIPIYLNELRHRDSPKLNQEADNRNFVNIPRINKTTKTVNTTINNVEYQINSTFEFKLNNEEKTKSNSISNESYLDRFRRSTSNFEFRAHRNESKGIQDSVKIGILFGMKSTVQMFVNLLVGPITQRIGYNKPMFLGFIILFFSTLVFAFSTSFEMLLFAQAFQGIGSSCTSVAGKSALASRYTIPKERDNALRISVGGSIVGLMFGPPFGGFMYQYFGRSSPFLAICGLTLIDGVLQLLMKQPKINESKQKEKAPSIWALLQDPYILLIAVGLFLLCGDYALFETSLPLWMLNTMQPTRTQMGTVFIPTTIGLLSVFLIFGSCCLKMGRWLMAMLGMVIIPISLIMITFAKSVHHLFIPNFSFGLAIGMTETALMPELAYIVDIRHTSVYGNAFAIADFFLHSGLALGPLYSGFILKYMGFHWMIYSASIVSLIYGLLTYLLRNPPAKNKKSQIVEEDSGNCLIEIVT